MFLFSFFVFLVRREHSNKRIIIITIIVHVLLVANRVEYSMRSGPEINGKPHFFLANLTRQGRP